MRSSGPSTSRPSRRAARAEIEQKTGSRSDAWATPGPSASVGRRARDDRPEAHRADAQETARGRFTEEAGGQRPEAGLAWKRRGTRREVSDEGGDLTDSHKRDVNGSSSPNGSPEKERRPAELQGQAGGRRTR